MYGKCENFEILLAELEGWIKKQVQSDQKFKKIIKKQKNNQKNKTFPKINHGHCNTDKN